MKMLAACLMLLLAQRAGAQSFITMGRLFTTPSERLQLDQQRNAAPRTPAPATAGTILPPAGQEPGETAPPPAPGSAPLAAGPAEAPGVRLDGLIRRSGGSAVVIVNGEVQPAPARASARGGVAVQAVGRTVVLKPGQLYDPATGEIHDAAR